MTKPLDCQGVDGGVNEYPTAKIIEAMKTFFLYNEIVKPVSEGNRHLAFLILQRHADHIIKFIEQNMGDAPTREDGVSEKTCSSSPATSEKVDVAPTGWQHWLKAHTTTPEHAREVQALMVHMFPELNEPCKESYNAGFKFAHETMRPSISSETVRKVREAVDDDLQGAIERVHNLAGQAIGYEGLYNGRMPKVNGLNPNDVIRLLNAAKALALLEESPTPDPHILVDALETICGMYEGEYERLPVYQISKEALKQWRGG